MSSSDLNVNLNNDRDWVCCLHPRMNNTLREVLRQVIHRYCTGISTDTGTDTGSGKGSVGFRIGLGEVHRHEAYSRHQLLLSDDDGFGGGPTVAYEIPLHQLLQCIQTRKGEIIVQHESMNAIRLPVGCVARLKSSSLRPQHTMTRQLEATSQSHSHSHSQSHTFIASAMVASRYVITACGFTDHSSPTFSEVINMIHRSGAVYAPQVLFGLTTHVLCLSSQDINVFNSQLDYFNQQQYQSPSVSLLEIPSPSSSGSTFPVSHRSSNIHVLSYEWLADSLQANELQEEIKYEVNTSNCASPSLPILPLTDSAASPFVLTVLDTDDEPRMVFMVTGGSAEQESWARVLIGKLGGEVVDEFDLRCTHLLVWNEVKRTEKFLYASAATGKWVLHGEQYLRACANEQRLLRNEPMFECGGPSSIIDTLFVASIHESACSRNRTAAQRPFLGKHFVIIGQLKPPADVLKRLVEVGGGSVDTLNEAAAIAAASRLERIDAVITTEQSFRDPSIGAALASLLLDRRQALPCLLPSYLLDALTSEQGNRLPVEDYIIIQPHDTGTKERHNESDATKLISGSEAKASESRPTDGAEQTRKKKRKK